MLATFWMVACTLVTAQAAGASEWLLVPRLSAGQELVYRGTYTEEVLGQGVQFDRGYQLESRVFVLDTPPQGADLALQTILRLRSNQPNRGSASAETEPSSVRLEVVRLDLQGRLLPPPGTSLTMPLEGPATVECGNFVEIPGNWVGRSKSWEVAEEGRPPRSWRVAGIEAVNSNPCLKLEGLQQSADWDHPRADSSAWRRQDTVWINPRFGAAARVERIVERREPAHREATHRSVVSYELESSLVYPGPLGEDCQREITQARRLAEAAEPYLHNQGKDSQRPLEAFQARIAAHVDRQPATPYRASILQVKSRIEAALRGESAPAGTPEIEAPAAAVAAVGKAAPDFVATDFTSQQSARLGRWLGQPILLVFYQPKSPLTEEVLHFAQAIGQAHGSAVRVVGLAVSDDVPAILKQRTELGFTYPVLAGRGLRISYAVESTPKLIVLDGDGVVRGAYVGWGKETPREVTGDLERCLQPEGRK
jgi:peroxiredoxin